MIFRFFDLDRNAPTLAAMYFAALFLILLFPFAVSSPYVTRDNSAAWSDGARGIAFGQSGLLIGAAPAAALHRRLTAGTGLTVELWLNTASIADDDQARIVTYSLNNWERNFTIDREEADIVLRLRTSRTYANGKPTFDVRGVLVPGKLQHVVVTYDFLEERVYVDGTPRAASALRQGNFATWDPSYYLAFGNEADGGKPWDGTLAYAAIYDRPLAADTVAARYRLKQDAPAEAGLLAAYDFTRGTAQGAGAIPDMPRLQKPARVASDSRLFFLYLDGTFHLTVTCRRRERQQDQGIGALPERSQATPGSDLDERDGAHPTAGDFDQWPVAMVGAERTEARPAARRVGKGEWAAVQGIRLRRRRLGFSSRLGGRRARNRDRRLQARRASATRPARSRGGPQCGCPSQGVDVERRRPETGQADGRGDFDRLLKKTHRRSAHIAGY
jgi:hypothetical protein